jgi:mono-ADP-ribosyltransferase sirtuin 6
LDNTTTFRFFTEADNLMERVMKKLDIPIPNFVLRRRLLIGVTSHDVQRHELTVVGVDSDNTPASFLRSVKLLHNRRIARDEPFIVNVRGDLPAGTHLKVVLEFMGNYNEPDLEIVHEHSLEQEKKLYLLAYNLVEGRWSTEVQNYVLSGQSA